MARRSDHTRDELRVLILDAAWKIVGNEGADALTARRLASEIGYAPGTVYNVFKDMDDVILQINLRTIDQLFDVLNSPSCQKPDKTPSDNAKHMAKLYIGFAREFRPYWLLLFMHNLSEGRVKAEDYQATIDRLFLPLEKILAPVNAHATAVELRLSARSLWASVHGLCFLQETGKLLLVEKAGRFESLTSHLIDTFIAGLKSTSR